MRKREHLRPKGMVHIPHILRIFAVALFVAQVGCGKTDPVSQNIVVFDNVSHDFGNVGLRSTAVVHRFNFTNPTDQPVRVVSTSSSCSCAVASSAPRIVPPSGRGYVDVELSLDTAALQAEVGSFERSVLVEFSNHDQPHVLAIRGTRSINHFFYPSQVRFPSVSLGTTASASFLYFPRPDESDIEWSNLAPSVSTSAMYLHPVIEKVWFEQKPVILPTSGPPEFDFALESSSFPRFGFRIEATLGEGAPAGQLFHFLTVHTKQEDDPLIRVPVSAEITEPLKIEPRRLYLGIVSSLSEIQRKIVMSSEGGENFQILHCSIDSHLLKVTPSQLPDGKWELLVEASGDLPNLKKLNGLITIRTDHSVMEKITIGYYGRVWLDSGSLGN